MLEENEDYEPDYNCYYKSLRYILPLRAASLILPLFATHVQLDEIENTPDEKRKCELIGSFQEIKPIVQPTGSFVFGASQFGSARLGNGELFSLIESALDNLNKNKKSNNHLDALIAETSILEGMTLITADQDLISVVNSFNGQTANLRDVLNNNECK